MSLRSKKQQRQAESFHPDPLEVVEARNRIIAARMRALGARFSAELEELAKQVDPARKPEEEEE